MNKDEQKLNTLKQYYNDNIFSKETYCGLELYYEIDAVYALVIDSYPDSIQNPSSYMNQKKVLKDLYRVLENGLEQHFPRLHFMKNEELITVTREEKEADARRIEAEKQRLIKEQKQAERKSFEDNHETIFRYKSSNSLIPNYVDFKPNDTTLNIMKKYLHDSSLIELEEHFQFTKEDYFRLEIKNGCIVHFENQNLNIGFMYAMNLLSNKMYTVKPLSTPKPLVNLLISGNKKDDIKAGTSDPLIRQKLKKLPLRILDKDRIDFCNFVFRHIQAIETFNPYFEKDLDFYIKNSMRYDKNKEQVVMAINKYLSENQMSISELFAIDTSDKEGMELHEICRKQLVAIFTVLISKYFKLYIENSIDMSEYTKNDKSSGDTETDSPSPDKKSNGSRKNKATKNGI
ncbi:hypothetical protein AB4264_25150 [Vibrio sp. 10N.261.55.B8]|uniref:hypothetical protein n=1 Tax=Vibrio sp. 10N.261.55.B8 TaxID=3229688 RepID=UPI00354CB709